MVNRQTAAVIDHAVLVEIDGLVRREDG